MFATRSPFRPNPIGLSCVVLEKVDIPQVRGPVLTVLSVQEVEKPEEPVATFY